MIERIHWTDHARLRLVERGVAADEVEQAVRDGHQHRELNRGDADWRAYGVRSDGRRFAVAYDHPVFGDSGAARIVTIWVLRDARN